jgi:hypothetical protein
MEDDPNEPWLQQAHLEAAMWILGDEVHSLRITNERLRHKIERLERENALLLHPNVPAHHQNINDNESQHDDGFIHDVSVVGSGVPEVNGTYSRVGANDGVPKYTKHVLYEGRYTEFSLYRCKMRSSRR